MRNSALILPCVFLLELYEYLLYAFISSLSCTARDVKGCEFNIDLRKYFYCNMSDRIRLRQHATQAGSCLCTRCGPLPALFIY